MAGCEEVHALLVCLRFLGPAPTTIAADLNYGLIFFRIGADIGFENITMVKVKSHLSRVAALARDIPFWTWAGNREA
eukprot:7100917-Pyramimonas_sp.AAC.1